MPPLQRLLKVAALLMVLAILVVADRSARRQPGPTSAASTPDQVHLSWVGDTSTTMAVTWRTAGTPGRSHVVQWGPSPGNYSGGEAIAEQVEAPGGRGMLHKAQITGLQPGTLYYYRVAGDKGKWSDDFSFRTAPASLPPGGVVFTVNGDLGASNRYANVRAVLDQIGREQAAFHLIAGDIAYADEEFGTATEEYFFSKDLPRIGTGRPVMVAWGNHEYRIGNGMASGVNIGTISRYFQLPSGQANACNPSPYYSFDYAGIHIVALDDPEPANICYDRQAMRAWLDRDLAQAAANPSIKWKVVFMHRPPFSGGLQGSTVEHRFLEFDRYGVDLVIAAHEHSYERTWPVSWDGAKTAQSYERPSYPTYIVAGTGGAPTTKAWTANPWSAFHDGGLNVGYLRVTATPSSLKGEFVGRPGDRPFAAFDVLDTFIISKEPRGNVSAP